MERPRALLLDLDGTLADTLPDLAAAVNHTRERLGWPPMPVAAVKIHIGDGIRRLLRGCTGFDDTEVETLIPVWRGWYLEHAVDETRLLPGAEALLDTADALGIRCAVVTNKPIAHTERILAGLGVRGRFGAVLGGDSLPTRKPDPEMVHEALRILRVPPSEAWLVGDGPQDVGAAKAAGAVSVLLPGYGDAAEARRLGPDLELPDLAAVAARLEG